MENPFFSVIIPSRNRASLFLRALNSVSRQITNNKFGFEVIVINDGSCDEELLQYTEIISNYTGSIKNLNLRFRELGHGPSFSRNEGVHLAEGEYICFLDDDDVWIDKEHLLYLFEFIENKKTPINTVYLFQQLAETSEGIVLTESLWNRDIIDRLAISDYKTITKKEVSKSAGFTHLNCLTCSRELFHKAGGFDESLRYEEDRDLYFRLIDHAEQINIFKRIVAKHYVPNKQLAQNVSTSMLEIDKITMRISSNFKLLSIVKDSSLRQSITKHLLHALKSAEKTQNDLDKKLFYSRMTLSIGFSMKWYFYVVYLKLRVRVNKGSG